MSKESVRNGGSTWALAVPRRGRIITIKAAVDVAGLFGKEIGRVLLEGGVFKVEALWAP